MTRKATIYLGLFICSMTHAIAVPMDVNASRRLPEIAGITTKVKSGTALNSSDEEKLYAEIESGQPALAALSIWALGETGQKKYIDKLSATRDHAAGLPSAFATIALAKCSPDWETTKIQKLKSFLGNTDNPYLPVEAARELTPFDPSTAADSLRKLLQQSDFPAKSAAAEVLERLGKTHPPVAPVSDDPYSIVIQTLEPPSPFTMHSLSAEREGSKLTSPFPTNADRLVFEWQLAAASSDPLGVRWIAENVSGVEKNHVIAKAKSDPNKQSGQFSLTKPTNGFPPGKYRVEIWQSGKEIYREPFEIMP